jgi:hypothetical protein
MSEYTLKRISFPDKDDSVLLNSNSKFVLTADNVNEIKAVVNNLCEEVENRLRFNQVFKYAKFNVPSTLKEGCSYTFEFELSEDSTFENVITFSLENNFSKFSIFENNVWNDLSSDRLIIYNDRNKSLKFDLSEIISDKFKPYFGRCRWINKSTLEIQEYQGFTLGIFEYNDKQFDDKIIKEFYITGKTTLKEKDVQQYEAYYKDNNGNIINVTENASFSTVLNVCSIENNSLIVPKLHTIKNEIIKAEFTYNSIKYTAFLNIVLNPILLESLKINGDIDLINSGEEKQFTITAVYSDGSVIDDITNDCEIILTMNNCSLVDNKIIGEENSCYDEYGSLVVLYVDKDFEEETLSVVKYINYKTVQFKSLEVRQFPNIIKGDETDLTYSIILTYENGVEKDVTNDVIINLIDCNEITCENGKISINDNLLEEKNVTCFIDYYDTSCKNKHISTLTSFKISPKYLVDITPTFYFNGNEIIEVEEKNTVSFNVLGTYNDGSVQEIDYNFLTLEMLTTSNIEYQNDSTHTIKIGTFEYQELILFNFKYDDNKVKIEKSKHLNIKPIKLQRLIIDSTELEINGNKNKFFAINDVVKTFDIKAVYSNGQIINVNDVCKIEIAAGDTALINSINKNQVLFNKPEYKEEAITLIVSYNDPDFKSESKSMFFIISVFQND